MFIRFHLWKHSGVIRNIIFDWSGTLVDDLPAVFRATNFVFGQAGVDELTIEQFRAEFCLPFKSFYDRYTPEVKMEQLEEWFHGHFKQVQDSVIELPHARDFLLFCRKHGIRTFLLSTVHRDHFAVQAGVIGFGELIDKPYVEILDKRTKIHEILEENQLAAGETMFIGDMQHDVETAKHGNVFSCAVLTGYNRLEQLRASEPDLIVEHLGDLQEILERTGFNIIHRKHGLEGSPIAHPICTVGAAIFNEADKVLMVRTQKWSNLWGIPGGKTKYGETSVAALHREIKEETDLEIADIEFVLVQDCIHSKEFYREAHFVLLNYQCRVRGRGAVTLNEEAQEFCWKSLDEALGMNLNQPTRILLEEIQHRIARE